MFKYYHNNKVKARKNTRKTTVKLVIILIRLKALFHQKSVRSQPLDFYIIKSKIKILKSII